MSNPLWLYLLTVGGIVLFTLIDHRFGILPRSWPEDDWDDDEEEHDDEWLLPAT